ncbi:MAG: BREX protein BrxB domain-containing protein, partial [Spirochaetales bacterium]
NRHYPFAIVHYRPEEEFRARELLGEMVDSLRLQGWAVRTIDLFEVLLDYLGEEEEGELVPAWIEEEKMLYKTYKNDHAKPLEFLGNSLGGFFNRKTGYPQKVLEEIRNIAQGADETRSVIFLSRIGALYPFYRTSALLRFLDEGVKVSTIVMYPGERVEQHYLSFMGEMDADRDYRPRIY